MGVVIVFLIEQFQIRTRGGESPWVGVSSTWPPHNFLFLTTYQYLEQCKWRQWCLLRCGGDHRSALAVSSAAPGQGRVAKTYSPSRAPSAVPAETRLA